MGSKDKAIAAASKGLWREALYRLQGAWLRLWDRHTAAACRVEAGWALRWQRQSGVKYWVAQQPSVQGADSGKAKGSGNDDNTWTLARLSTHRMRFRGCTIHHHSHKDRNSGLQDMFDIWYHVALVNLHIIDDPAVNGYLEERICKVHWAIEFAADCLGKYPSNWSIR